MESEEFREQERKLDNRIYTAQQRTLRHMIAGTGLALLLNIGCNVKETIDSRAENPSDTSFVANVFDDEADRNSLITMGSGILYTMGSLIAGSYFVRLRRRNLEEFKKDFYGH